MKYVYSFKEGNKDMKNQLGGKGANLAEMIAIGLPVPSGFTVSTDACLKYYEDNETLSEEIIEEIYGKVKELEKESSKKFGDLDNPLLLSIRSGSRASMPGMMDTVLNLGLNDQVAEGFSRITNNPRFVYDSYRRFIQMFADVVKGFPRASFETLLENLKETKGLELDTDLTADDLKELVEKYKEEYFKYSQEEFPQDPNVQLIEAIKAVFRSWNNDRAIAYRKLNEIPNSWGTAVNVQEMVYGNKGETSGTGVAFTRNPSTGEKKLFGEFLMNAQGEDVVAGIRTPEPIAKLKEIMPECYEEFVSNCQILENHYKDMQDMEFTIEDGKLFMLQTRSGKRTTAAALKIACDLVEEKMISKEEALMMVEPKQLEQLLHSNFNQESLKEAKVIAKGLAASPGAVSGKIYFSADDVLKAHENNIKEIILVRLETSPEDIEGMNLAQGILTARGGMTSHAAVVARGMGRPCVSGSEEITVDEAAKTFKTVDGQVYHEGDWISLDGSTGLVYEGQIESAEASLSGDFQTFMNWADEYRRLKIRTNADTPKEAEIAKEFGAEGIGLCRTEHMFFETERIFNFRKMITADNLEDRTKALDEILPSQRSDFEELFRIMDGRPLTIRYLDPPLHEFLPHTDEEIQELSDALKIEFNKLKERINSLKEFNPMMGHRGARLSISYPEIAIMQTRSIIEAALNVKKEGKEVNVELMIPLIGEAKELIYLKEIVKKEADQLIKESGLQLDYSLGTMVELPRACIIADELAEISDFFSFGTNDLTQMTYGFSRDDVTKFLNTYYKNEIFAFDPFERIDQKGVGVLMKTAVKLAKTEKENIKLGICGEHAGEPSSIEFCHNLGLDYVSCSPYRIPVAKLAAARAALKTKKD